MKTHLTEFLRRGQSACGIGPLVLAVLYLIMARNGAADQLTVSQVCTGIFSLSALAFIAGGMNFIYRIERLPLMAAIFIHGSVLYISYLITYLLNRWLVWGIMSVLIFTGIFLLGYLAIWAVIYAIIKRKTAQVNEGLKKKREKAT